MLMPAFSGGISGFTTRGISSSPRGLVGGCSFQGQWVVLGDSFGLLDIPGVPFQVTVPLQLQIRAQDPSWARLKNFPVGRVAPPSASIDIHYGNSTPDIPQEVSRGTGPRESRRELLPFDLTPKTRGSTGRVIDRLSEMRSPLESCLVQGCSKNG